MRIKRNVLIAVVALLTINRVLLYAQAQSTDDIPIPAPQFQDQGGVTPWFWVGLQTVFSGGYNFETTAGGFRNYGGDNYTYASFNLAFVDSHYQTPKFYEVPRELDPDAWTGHFILRNFTSRINSWENGATGVENNSPAWLAEIAGKGVHIGFFTQAGILVGSLFDSGRGSATDVKPITKISGGNKVLNLGDNDLGKVYYDIDSGANSPTATVYSTSSGAIWYAGYEKRERWNVYLSMLSEGNVDSDVRDGKNDAFAGVADFMISPFGLYTNDETPLTFKFSGNAITGFRWETTANTGFGFKGEGGIWLRDNFVLAPALAFDSKIDSDNNYTWKIGGGLTFQFSGMRWITDGDDWGDLQTLGENAVNWRYENNKVLKYAYAQVYGAYSEATDFDMLFRVEEPDGNVGFHEKLGFMGEFRLYNALEKNTAMKWEMQGRVSWDFNIKSYLVTPYVRGYLNDDAVFKLRLGAYANIIPYAGFEIAYTSANLNQGVDLAKPSYLNASYEKYFDAGRIELLVILKSDEIRPHVPKRMSDWNYPGTVQHN